ncbi:MAG: T9SS type A sorting domain-containing protein [Saprospiraceae bacterium]|nr:T9SS type A sorting domain-containing protein [Candidatus Defluviibacterium haderslevense]
MFHVTDECGNSTDCYTEVTVADLVPPIAVCDQKTVVSLTIDGTAKIEAITFDDGSLDNCMIDRFEVKRMDDGIPCNTINGNQWGPYVFFCCADIGKTIMVSLRVWDKAGNSNTCMVEVQVQDKIPPIIFCPPHITVSCEFDYADLSVFGTVVTDFNLRKPIQINDPKVKHSGPLVDGYAYDGCGVVVKELPPINNLICNRGTITRTFEATDISGLKSICTQIITIQDLNPNNVTVRWPADFLSSSNCTAVPMLQPDVTGKPIVSGADKCNQIMVTHEDQLFTLEPDACIKILRKWTIIDWCIYQANNPATGGYWTWTQIIKVSNTVAPTFTSSCADRSIDVYGPGCGGNISLVGTAKDDCTDSADLVWYHSVDLYNDGLSPGIEYLRSGPGADASGTYPVGKHRITYFVKDGCNNETRCSFVITVVDAKKPTPYCNGSITTTIMPSTKAISIWAKDFNINSEDNCTSKENLKYYFLINNIKLPSLNLDCSNIGLNKIRMYVEDEAGNSDYCEVTLDLQDPNKVCGGTFLRASGNMTTPDGRVMPKGKLTAINTNTGNSKEIEVQANGNYSFNDLTKGGSYRIKSTYNEDPLNGVSTQDIVLIQKHILGQQVLDSPYKYIAADANNSGSISAADISEIRKLILGIIPKFNQNESWRFIPKGYVFQNKNKPFPFEEEILHQNITTNCLNDDFYAVKIGDINGNVNLFNTAATRTLGSYTIEVENKTIHSEETVRIPIYASQDMSILGMQLALEFANGLRIDKIESGTLPIQSEQYVLNQNDLILSFVSNNVINIKAGEVLFYVDVIKTSNQDIYSLVQINSNKLIAEIYDISTEAYTIKLYDRNSSKQEPKLKLFQNVPNPFRDKTYIQFLSSNTEEAKIQIINLDGKVLYDKVVNNPDAIQGIEIDNSILYHSGVYMVKLLSQGEMVSLKIIKI